MDKNAIKKYAVWARRELISRVSQRAALYGITEKDIGDASAASVNGNILSETEKKQRQALIAQIRSKGYQEVMEEAAYTWFNRFSALRFMEVNGYLPSHVRVFTDDENAFKPQILAEAINLEIDGIDMEKVYARKNANDNDELFKYLIIVQCNALSEILPGMFQRIADYTELLFPDNLLREGSAVEQMIALIPQEDWQDAVQILGWLYQYYNTEKKDDVFAALKKNVKITKENIPAATQLFTPDWIVRYMVENSLGRIFIEKRSREGIYADGRSSEEMTWEQQETDRIACEKAIAEEMGWKYYLEEARQEPEVRAQLEETRKEYAAIQPEEIKVIDPCMGSGHILAYMFDVLMQIYEAYGYTSREAVASIVENNIYGLDIDERAAQLAYFAVMMKARQYDRRFFSRGIQPHVYAIQESNDLDSYAVEYFCDGRDELKKAMKILIDELHDAKEYGSILNVSYVDFAALYARIDEIREDISIYREAALAQLVPFIQCAEVMTHKYHVVSTNPPYMGGTGMNQKLIDFVFANYPDSKYDLFSVCIEKFIEMTLMNGFTAMITMESWMFLASFERLRSKLLDSNTIINMVHMPYLGKGGTSLGISFGTEASVVCKRRFSGYNSQYMCVRYYETDNEGVPYSFPTINERYVSATSDGFDLIAGKPIAYWTSKNIYAAFRNGKALECYAEPRQGVKTLDNERFLKLWFEVPYTSIEFHAHSQAEATLSARKWFPYNKGGEYRRWYGNNYYVVNWENDGFEMKEFAIKKYGCVTRTITNIAYFYKPGLTWSALTTAAFSIRWFDEGFIFDSKGSSMYFNSEDERVYVIGFMNSKVASHLLKILAPTLDFNVGPMKKLPILMNKDYLSEIHELVNQSVSLARNDWDSVETSWDFKQSPLIGKSNLISEAYEIMVHECKKRFAQMKSNEERLNDIYITIYNLNGEMDSEIDDSEITLKIPTPLDAVKALISYAVGCMFGRYSLDCQGVCYTGGTWEKEKYTTFVPDKDNIIPICDDEYFEDDIVGRFVEFVKIAFGEEKLEENIGYVATILGGKGNSREIIRNYFINDFYKDHCSMYSVVGAGKRPIYWLFDSGKKNGFKSLIYVHRYQPDTIARIRTDYVHEQQSRYRTAISDLQNRIANASTGERVKLNKRMKTLQDQAEEIRVYEEKIHHLADQMISIDLDDGVKHNYELFKDVLAKIK